jgi:hypothetical protein
MAAIAATIAMLPSKYLREQDFDVLRKKKGEEFFIRPYF